MGESTRREGAREIQEARDVTMMPMPSRWLPLVTSLSPVVVLPPTLAQREDAASSSSSFDGQRLRHGRRELFSSEVGDDAASASNEGVRPIYTVYRMLGNDILPLQGIGQTRRNTAFALAHEPPPPPGLVRQHCVTNRIVNATERAHLKSASRESGRRHTVP